MDDDVDLGWRGDEKRFSSLASIKKAQLERAKMREISARLFPGMRMLLQSKNSALRALLATLNKVMPTVNMTRKIVAMNPAAMSKKTDEAMAVPVGARGFWHSSDRKPEQTGLAYFNKVVLGTGKDTPSQHAGAIMLAAKGQKALTAGGFGINPTMQAVLGGMKGVKINAGSQAFGSYNISSNRAGLQKMDTRGQFVHRSPAALSQRLARRSVVPSVPIFAGIERPFNEIPQAQKGLLGPAPRHEKAARFDKNSEGHLASTDSLYADLTAAVTAGLSAILTPDLWGGNRASAPMPVMIMNPEDLHGATARYLTSQAGVQTGPTGFDYSLTLPHPTGAYL